MSEAPIPEPSLAVTPDAWWEVCLGGQDGGLRRLK